MNAIKRIFLLGLALSAQLPSLAATNITVACAFSTVASTWTAVTGDVYVCDVNASFPSPVSTVVAIEGEHAAGKTDSSVQILHIQSPDMQLLPSNFDAFFTALEGLILQEVPLFFLGSDDLATFGGLKFLIVDSAELSVITRGTFDDNAALELIELQNNRLTFIDAAAFDGLSNLRFLNLEGILCLSDDPAPHRSDNDPAALAALKALVGQKCADTAGLQTLLARTIRDFVAATVAGEACTTQADCEAVCSESLAEIQTNLTSCDAELSRANAVLASIDDEVEELKQQLDDCRTPVNGTCRFRDTPDYGYACVAAGVTVDGNATVVWGGEHVDAGRNDSSVVALILRAQSVLLVPQGVAAVFGSVTALVVDGSRLSVIARGDFAEWSALQRLEIVRNEIASIAGGAFDALTALEYLDLSANRIATLPSRAFERLTALTYLDVSGNDLSVLRFDAIATSNRITQLRATGMPNMTVDLNFVWRLQAARIIDFAGSRCAKTLNKDDDPTIRFLTFFTAVFNDC